jgi:diguanylate cyclase
MVIVRAVLGLGRSLDIPVVAEGVETEEQLEFLRGELCAEVQGYKIGRPAPVASVAAWTDAVEAVAAPPVRKRRKSAA